MQSTSGPPPSSAKSQDDLDDAYLAELDVGLDDPWQAMNRKLFRFNQALDRWLLNPIARGYGWLLPDPLERSIRRVLDNLDEPAIALDHALQLEGRWAGRSLARFLVNSTLGLAGLADPAGRMGLPDHPADFGQTLGKAGVAAGPYLVVPLLGPANPRDLLGLAVDSALHAESYLLPGSATIALSATDAISQKELYREDLAELEHVSIDYYAALRAGYASRRDALLRDRSCPGVASPSPAGGDAEPSP